MDSHWDPDEMYIIISVTWFFQRKQTPHKVKQMIYFSCGILCVLKQVEWVFLLISWGWTVTFYGFGQGGHNAMKQVM